jgi:hypothetical protein
VGCRGRGVGCGVRVQVRLRVDLQHKRALQQRAAHVVVALV